MTQEQHAMTDEELVRRAREALEDLAPGPWSIQGDDGVTCYLRAGQTVLARYYCGETIREALFTIDARHLVPVMADRIEALTAELDRVRAYADEMRTAAELFRQSADLAIAAANDLQKQGPAK